MSLYRDDVFLLSSTERNVFYRWLNSFTVVKYPLSQEDKRQTPNDLNPRTIYRTLTAVIIVTVETISFGIIRFEPPFPPSLS